MSFVFATHNPGKLREVQAIFSAGGLTVRSLAEMGITGEIVEDGETFRENAIIKATAVRQMLSETGAGGGNYTVLADDSGLEVDALENRPGVYSARFLGADTPAAEKNKKLLDMLAHVPNEERSARFVCVIACVWPDGQVFTTGSIVAGRIAREPAGANGFGYDPVFFLPEYGLSMAQLDTDEKNRISHRAQALRLMFEQIRQIRRENL